MSKNYLNGMVQTEEKWSPCPEKQGYQCNIAGAVQIVNNGSLYPVQQGKHTWGYSFYYTVEGSEKKRKTVTGKDKEEIKAKVLKFLETKNAEYLERLEAQRREQEELNKPITFEEASMEWFNQYRLTERLSYASVESRECSLKAINRKIGSVPVSKIDNETAKELIKICSKKADGSYYSRSHVDKLQQVFQLVMEYCVKNGYCQTKPDKVPLARELTEPDKDAMCFTKEQLKIITEAVKDNPRYRILVMLLVATGMRQEEGLALNINDFKPMPGGVVEINIDKTVVEERNHNYDIVPRTKTKQSRRKVYIPNEIYEEVKQYYEDCINSESQTQKWQRAKNGMDGCIFLNKDMKPVNKRTLQRNFKDYLSRDARGKKIDFKVNLHMFRHTFVSVQTENIYLDKVALIIGDSISTTSKMYQSLTDVTKEQVCVNTAQLYDYIYKK